MHCDATFALRTEIGTMEGGLASREHYPSGIHCEMRAANCKLQIANCENQIPTRGCNTSSVRRMGSRGIDVS